ncbi:MAG: hypothetical protein ABI547_04330 [Betaproteobacteria bacterium]
MLVSRGKSIGIWPALYCLWAVFAIGLSIALAGLSAESITRLLVMVFLLGQIALRARLVNAFPRLAPRTSFVVLGSALAAVVEGFHMISTPVFLSLRIDRNTSFAQGLANYALDLLFTLPAYLVVFSVIWCFINRYRFTFWQYVIVIGLGQVVGDGGLFYFLNAPAMLFFLPYPMTNYHAINVIPFLAVRDRLNQQRSASAFAYVVVPALIGTYLVCGAIIKIVGRYVGLESS